MTVSYYGLLFAKTDGRYGWGRGISCFVPRAVLEWEWFGLGNTDSLGCAMRRNRKMVGVLCRWDFFELAVGLLMY
jgi:hypothetical protein